jgi:hypothetical protein
VPNIPDVGELMLACFIDKTSVVNNWCVEE